MTSVLITGAAGRVGSFLRAGLPGLGHEVWCLDRTSPTEPDGLPWIVADITDPAELGPALTGYEAVVHLAAIPTEDAFGALARTNIDGTYHVFEAARAAGVKRLIYASSTHAVGFHAAGTVPDVSERSRPDSLYGVTKAFGEALGSFYADRHGLDVAAVRLGSCCEQPPTVRSLATWLSPGDVVRLVDALLRAPSFGFRVVYGISANTRAFLDLGPALALGYRPHDDAEVFAERLLAEQGPVKPGNPDARWLGGRAIVGEW